MFLKKSADTLSPKREKFNALTIILLVLLIVYAISLLIPLFWGFISSFKDRFEFRLNVIGMPKEWVWNYSVVYDQFIIPVSTPEGQVDIGVGLMFLYGFLYAIGCAFFATLVPCITSYMCAKFKYKFSGIIYTIVIVVMILPIIGSTPSEIQLAKSLGLFDQIWGLWLMKANFLGLYFLVFYAMFKSLPDAYAEAATIDGAGNFTIMLRVSMPLVRNTFFTVLLVNFIQFWNDYQTPLIYLPSYPTIARGMYVMASTNGNAMSYVPMRMACAMMMVIPILVLFSIFQKRLLGNLTVGGIKG